MSSSNGGGHIAMAFAIGGVASISTTANVINIMEWGDFDFDDGLFLSTIVFQQASLALAMICAVIVGYEYFFNSKVDDYGSGEPPMSPETRIETGTWPASIQEF